jgi:5-methyltetrahydropteroyltriglutamate--homocysteine methyltransferase
MDRAALRPVEDAAIRGAVALQESVGLSSITDGEFRRDWWHIDFLRGFDGVETSTQSFGVRFEGADEQPPLMKVTGKIRRTRPSMLDHFTFLKSATTRTAKFCLPSPVMLHARGDRSTLRATYPDLAEFWADLTAAYREEIGALCRAGCTYLQIDDTTVAMMCDPKVRAQVTTLGDDPEQLPGIYAEAVNAVLRDVPPEVTVAIHTCRGNFKSTWMASGGYDPVAETVFTRLNVKAFFLEYDSDRAGGFEPLRFVPKGKTVVLGLISSKVPELEKKGRPQAPHRRGRPLRAAREPLPEPAVRLFQHAPRQQDHGRGPEAEARPRARGRARRLGRGGNGSSTRVPGRVGGGRHGRPQDGLRWIGRSDQAPGGKEEPRPGSSAS